MKGFQSVRAALRVLQGAVLLIPTAPAIAQDANRGGFYWSTDLGVSFIQDTTVKVSGASRPKTGMTFDLGARFDAALGYQFGSMDVGFETGVIVNSTDSIENEFGGRTDFAFYQVPFLVNFLYRIPTRSRFHPFVGGGIGGVGTVLEDYDLFYGTSDDTFGFGWQGTAGCTYQISPAMDLGICYKYLGTTERSFDSLHLKMEGTHTHSVTFLFLVRF